MNNNPQTLLQKINRQEADKALQPLTQLPLKITWNATPDIHYHNYQTLKAQTTIQLNHLPTSNHTYQLQWYTTHTQLITGKQQHKHRKTLHKQQQPLHQLDLPQLITNITQILQQEIQKDKQKRQQQHIQQGNWHHLLCELTYYQLEQQITPLRNQIQNKLPTHQIHSTTKKSNSLEYHYPLPTKIVFHPKNKIILRIVLRNHILHEKTIHTYNPNNPTFHPHKQAKTIAHKIHKENQKLQTALQKLGYT